MKHIILALMIAVLFGVSGASAQEDPPETYWVPRWSPNGESIALTIGRGDDFGIWRINPDGSGLTHLTPEFDTWNAFPFWSPDGSQLLFLATTDDGSNSDILQADLWLMDADGSNQVNLTANVDEAVEGYAWSPVGDRIALVTLHGTPEDYQETVWFLDPISGELEEVVSVPPNVSYGFPSWSYSGSQIALYAVTQPPQTVEILIVDTESLARTTYDTGLSDIRVVWSPVEEQVVLILGRDPATDESHVVMVNLETGDAWDVVPVDGYYRGFSDWSADGERIAFSAFQGDSRVQIDILEVESGTLTRLAPDLQEQYVWNAAFSPDGTRIAFTSDTPPRHRLWVADLESGTTTQILGN